MKRNAAILPFLLLAVMPLITCSNDIHSQLRNYMGNRFNVELDGSYVITTHTRRDVYEYFINKLFYDHEKAKRELNTCAWTTQAPLFADSVFSRDSSGEFHGLFLDFRGDSLSGYQLRFYHHGLIDSVTMLYGCEGLRQIARYKNGVLHGVSESFNPDGSRSTFYKYDHGTPVDTQYMWYDNGNPMRVGVFENGKLVWEKCYEEDGATEMECDF